MEFGNIGNNEVGTFYFFFIPGQNDVFAHFLKKKSVGNICYLAFCKFLKSQQNHYNFIFYSFMDITPKIKHFVLYHRRVLNE